MLKDPLIRRFVSSSLFAAAFVWVAVRFFHVETEVVWVLFWVSFLFVGIMMLIGLVLAPAIRLMRRQPTFLSRLNETERDADKD